MKTILAIDGGGIRGIIPAAALQQLEQLTGRPLSECFDMIVGTSTGGILAAALASPDKDGKPLFTTQQIIDFYMKDSKRIFKQGRFPILKKLRMLFRSKHDNDDLERVLFEKLGDFKFGNMMTKVMIPTYDLTDQRPYFFKSWKEKAAGIPTYKIVTATCSAPTFFDPTLIHIDNGEAKYLVDGAVAADNPAMCAYVEAKRLWGDEDIFILSLGAGDVSDPIHPKDKKKWGAISWLSTIAEIFMNASVNTIDYQLRTVTPDMYVRLQQKITIADEGIDNATDKNLALLKKEADLFVSKNMETLITVSEVLKNRLTQKR